MPNPSASPFRSPLDASLQFLEAQRYEARVNTLCLFSNLTVTGSYIGDAAKLLITGATQALDHAGGMSAVLASLRDTSAKGYSNWAACRAETLTKGAAGNGDAKSLPSIVAGEVTRIWQMVKDFLCEVAGSVNQALREFVRESFDKPDVLITQIVTAILAIVSQPAFQAYSAVTAIKDGILELFDMGIRTLVSSLRARSVRIRKGFAQALVDGVWVGAAMRAGNGLANIGIGLLTLPLSAMPAAGPVAKAVLTMVQCAAFLFFRLYESCMLEKLAGQARHHLQAGGYMRYGRFTPGAECGNALAHDTEAFYRWFRPYAVCVPAVSALVLGSRICGNRDLYLELCGDDGQPVAPQVYAAGVDHLGQLVHVAEVYLKNSGLTFDFGGTWLTGHMTKIMNPSHRVGPPADKFASMPEAVRRAYTARDRATVARGVWSGIGHSYAQAFDRWRGK
ncbi:hypothetical protein [Bordetella genomosp. 11]|uniref:Uncharacterized protein n=1 Tax=Bordetella genomosp. 11 TaxID=1416808 RepID=A0A261UE45_9BORD|nr:hypothetical protein [Bordetella genomosp. 11]OZI59777.1 hypothetical protein CAL28_09755 [Bordetella genomosp. 11]